MALIKCPECEHSISDKALKCPNCGYPIQEFLQKEERNSKSEIIDNSESDREFVDEWNPRIHETIPTQNKSKKKLVVTLIAVCIVLLAAVALAFYFGLFSLNLTVEDITISKWRLVDSTDYSDVYEGTITSEQKKPFVAVIGQYEDDGSTPQFVYVEDGEGVLETWEDTDDDPSIMYRPIGYLGGSSVDISDLVIKYADSDYYDWSYSEYSSCDVLISIDMNNTKSGLLVFDIINETNNETERNVVAVIIDGKTEYYYYAELPYKARGIDVSIVPKLFCESEAIKEEDYIIEKAYKAELDEGTYWNSYSGEVTLSFGGYADGFVLYTRELKEGGEKEERNVLKYGRAFLHDEEITVSTYDSVDADLTILMPKYEFNYVGYVTWTPLEQFIKSDEKGVTT